MMGILSDYMYVSPKNESSSKEVNQHLLFWAVIFPNAPGTPDRDHHTDGKQNLDMKEALNHGSPSSHSAKVTQQKRGNEDFLNIYTYINIFIYKYIYIYICKHYICLWHV